MAYLKSIIILLALSILLNACQHNPSSTYIPAKDCIELNNKGVEYLLSSPFEVKDRLDKAIRLFNQAIECDSNYLLPYTGLTDAYDEKHLYDKEMVTFNKLILLVNNDPAILLQKGMLYERKNQPDSARKIYQLAKLNFEKGLNKNPGNVNLISGIIELKALTEDKNEAIKELDKQLKIHPELIPKISYLHEFYRFFDRHEYVFRETTTIDLNK